MRVLALSEVAEGHEGGLDAVRYSRYKYGQVAAVESIAAELARFALDGLPYLLAEPVTLTAPASRAVPIGADLLTDAVLRRVNHERARLSHEPAVRAKLYRYHVPSGDYGSQNLAVRRELLAAERISAIPELFAGRHVVVVDDLWVTGTSAEVTAGAIRRWAPASVTYLVIGRVEPGYAERHPQVEYELNHAAVDGLPALADLCRQGPVAINQRLCKFVLGQAPERLAAWLPDIAPELVWRLHSAALAEGFGLMPAYGAAAEALAAHVEDHKLEALAMRHGWSPAS